MAPARGFALLDLGTTGTPVLPEQVVLELKFRGQMPAIFQALVEQFGLERLPASKYRLGMVALGHVLDATDADEMAEVGRLRKVGR